MSKIFIRYDSIIPIKENHQMRLIYSTPYCTITINNVELILPLFNNVGWCANTKNSMNHLNRQRIMTTLLCGDWFKRKTADHQVLFSIGIHSLTHAHQIVCSKISIKPQRSGHFVIYFWKLPVCFFFFIIFLWTLTASKHLNLCLNQIFFC